MVLRARPGGLGVHFAIEADVAFGVDQAEPEGLSLLKEDAAIERHGEIRCPVVEAGPVEEHRLARGPQRQ